MPHDAGQPPEGQWGVCANKFDLVHALRRPALWQFVGFIKLRL